MLLLAIEIDLDSFFDVNLVVFTTVAFLFSVLAVTLLVFGLRPITARARIAKDLAPEKLNITYLRLIMYILAEFIAFVSDIFLVIFGNNYKLPWATTTVFLTITFYKLVFVLFRDFRDLGFNAKGITDSLKTATKVVTSKSLDPISKAIDKSNDEENKKDNQEIMNKKVKFKKNTLRSKLPILLIFLLSVSCISWKINKQMSSQQAHSIVLAENSLKETPLKIRNIFTAEGLVNKTNKERELEKKINRIKESNSDKIIASEFTETRIGNEIDNEKDLFNYDNPAVKTDTIIITKRSKPWLGVRITYTNK
jgi:hypothetical protein